MDAVARVVRSSSGGSRCQRSPLVVVQDDGYDTVGGDVVFRRLLDRLRGDEAVIVCLDTPPHVYSMGGEDSLQLIDCFTNPYGMKMGETMPSAETVLTEIEHTMYTHLGDVISSNDAQCVETQADPRSRGGTVVGIDGLSTLVQYAGFRRVARFLSRVRRHPKVYCVVGYLHTDMHDAHEVALVRQDALCLVHLLPGWGLAVEQSRPGDSLGKLVLRIKRSQGCSKTESYEYWLDGDADAEGLRIEPIKEQRHMVSQESKPASVSTVLQLQMGSNMKLELSEEEKKAKTSVVLPYEHQGHHGAYHTNDYRDYLPPEAGGHGPSSGHLGHILYVRDSDSEGDFDSDEDPDDDLDI